MVRIVVIDQDKELLDASYLILEAKGYEVITSNNLSDGQRIIEEKHPDLVILDSTNTNRLDNFVLATKLKKENAHLPIIMFKTINMEIGIDDEKNVDDFIVKPISPSELISKIDRNLLLSIQE
ncbi:MAG: response regulator [Ignavibacteriaceae bacterium]